MKLIRSVVMAIGLTGLSSLALATPILESGAFIANVTNKHGFETGGYLGSVEDGISVTSVDGSGTTIDGSFVWPQEGNLMWYGGVTSIKRTDGAGIDSIQFLASTGFWDPKFFHYELRNQGQTVLSGTTTITASSFQNVGTFQTFGFSGGGFDEVLLNANASASDLYFSGALALENIELGGSSVAVPAPGAFALALLGFALGAITRRRLR